ncbi:O-antigen biosynthesis protein WbqV [Endobacter medicaginis]|uniref:O-antigen biosynthesis protein WbqV n=3 Tax=Endobacter medicaginis TaxID=1181271 RepID=A0A839V4B5_9PROT|nr:nucleoside-diphosphate sugar epimerase/dehydratase [Endobacter medicaginis]MBB3174311.1 O-antigen biosynthesis protein WbqV [Endobacter medicaginis]MCX5476193.1 nucleoside-diphosphate sugar epimerase/dehydratase [Endobacter medicaginis]
MPSQRSVKRIAVNIALDGGLAAMAAIVAHWLADPRGGWLHPLWFLAGGGITLVLAGAPFRLPQHYWRFSSVADLIAVTKGSAAAAIAFAAGLLLTGTRWPSPTFPIIHMLTLLVFLGGPRLAWRIRLSRAGARQAADPAETRHVLLVGADEIADLFLRAVGSRAVPLRIDGLLAMGTNQPGRRIHGFPILGMVDEVETVLERLAAEGRRPDALVITDPDLRGAPLAALIERAAAAGVAVQRAPHPTMLGPADPVELHPVAIEDLLNRPEVVLDRAGLSRLVAGRRVLITGAGGTIGSELTRQIAALGPSAMLLLDQSEYALWQISIETGEAAPLVERREVIADIRDAARIDTLFRDFAPELVVHAAALKHVPIVEANPLEGILTNVCGTRNVVDAARRAGARAMVLISTDKAVYPSSLMGATKRLAEIYCQALDGVSMSETVPGMRIVTVRFGNVLGSSGSVVPLFRRQLARGGPLTVTHPDMTRYFMTVPEAVSLVLQASALGTRTETTAGAIFVLDMGAPVRIVDLARQLIRLAGLRPEIDIPIVFTGPRPGEKLHEELFHGAEPPVPTGHPGLLLARPRIADAEAVAIVADRLEEACRAGDTHRARVLVARLVPEYRPPETVPAVAAAPLLAVADPIESPT